MREKLQNVRLALSDVMQETWGSVDGFYKTFAKERKNGLGSSTCASPCKCIPGPEGKDLVEEVKNFQRRWNRN